MVVEPSYFHVIATARGESSQWHYVFFCFFIFQLMASLAKEHGNFCVVIRQHSNYALDFGFYETNLFKVAIQKLHSPCPVYSIYFYCSQRAPFISSSFTFSSLRSAYISVTCDNENLNGLWHIHSGICQSFVYLR